MSDHIPYRAALIQNAGAVVKAVHLGLNPDIEVRATTAQWEQTLLPALDALDAMLIAGLLGAPEDIVVVMMDRETALRLQAAFKGGQK